MEVMKECGPSPVRVLRERLGLSRGEFSELADVAYARYVAVELGQPTRLPIRMIVALRQAGIDVDELEIQYAKWRARRAQSLREKLAAAAV